MDEFSLKRYPHNDLLKAWDAADELLIEEVKANHQNVKRILIINDAFGALSIALQEYETLTYTDSFVSFKAMELNGDGLVIINDLEKIKESFDLVILKLPKSLSFFEDILATLNNCLDQETPIICAGMVKHMAKGYFDLIADYIGQTHTSLAKKKARLIFSKLTCEKKVNPHPKSIYIEPMKKEFINHSNLFSRNKLDIGTRFFLDHLPSGQYETILDLGCANGIVGIKAKLLNPKAKIIFSDDSYMAIKSARQNFKAFGLEGGEFHWTNCFEDGTAESLDLVLCNPPFHQNHTVGTHIAYQMFKDAKKALRKGGQIRVIGNSHLGYHQSLKKLFGKSVSISNNKKFMIIEAFK